jgi:hypothetical protein
MANYMRAYERTHKQNQRVAAERAAKRVARQADPNKVITFSCSFPTNTVILNGHATDWYVERMDQHVPGKRTGLWRARRRDTKAVEGLSTYPTRLDAARAALGLL